MFPKKNMLHKDESKNLFNLWCKIDLSYVPEHVNSGSLVEGVLLTLLSFVEKSFTKMQTDYIFNDSQSYNSL